MMKTPEFWYKEHILGKCLQPLGLIYGAITACRISFSKPISINIPVISIGNLTVGGTGKTPIAIHIAETLRRQGERPAVILRGYGGRFRGPLKVSQKRHTAYDVGDEAVLHSRHGETWIAHNRLHAAVEAEKCGATIIILDDAHQHTSLKKDFSILVIDGEKGFGNRNIIPAGPLREDIDAGLDRADSIVIMRGITNGYVKELAGQYKFLKARLQTVDRNAKLTGARVVAFAGIGHPDYFFEALNNSGAEVIKTYSYPDHYKYSYEEITDITNKAHDLNAIAVTTEKDATRISPEQLFNISVLQTKVEWENPSEISQLLQEIFTRWQEVN